MHTAHCLCGRIGYEFGGELRDAHFCHCSICRRWTGSAFAAWHEVANDNIRWLSGGDEITSYWITERLASLFCPTCGVTVLARHRSWPESRYVPLGVLDDNGDIAMPTYHQFAGSGASWYRICDPLPQYEDWPPGR